MTIQDGSRSEQRWLDAVRQRLSRGDFAGAELELAAAITQLPRSFELRRALAGIHLHMNRRESAEAILGDLLCENPGDVASAFTLAQLLISQARTKAAAETLCACFKSGRQDPRLAIRAIELLDQADRKAEANFIAALAIAWTPDDARLHAYAGMLELQMGNFQQAREHYLYALEHSAQACEWHAPQGLAQAQRYPDASHPDFDLFRECLKQTGLSDKARSTLLFALGKAHDDIGDHATAAAYLRDGNELAHRLTRWSRKTWRRGIEAMLSAGTWGPRELRTPGFTPIFIVGMPRSGTTLLAELLSRYPHVRNRGETPWLAHFSTWPELINGPKHEALQRAAEKYAQQLRQDDGTGERWFIDKQPLNFRYIGLALSLFADAKIVHCRRGARDTALSLWMQSFDEEVQGYAYDFSDIAVVMRDEQRLMAHWRKLYPNSIREICYEDVAAAPQRLIPSLADWIGLPPDPPTDLLTPSTSPGVISTASLWQARQPVSTRSIGRHKSYLSALPELLRFPEGQREWQL